MFKKSISQKTAHDIRQTELKITKEINLLLPVEETYPHDLTRTLLNVKINDSQLATAAVEYKTHGHYTHCVSIQNTLSLFLFL